MTHKYVTTMVLSTCKIVWTWIWKAVNFNGGSTNLGLTSSVQEATGSSNSCICMEWKGHLIAEGRSKVQSGIIIRQTHAEIENEPGMKSSSWARCGVSIMRNMKGFDHVIMAPHCTTWQKNVSLGSTYIDHNAYPRVSCYSYLCKSWYMLSFSELTLLNCIFYHFCTLQRFL